MSKDWADKPGQVDWPSKSPDLNLLDYAFWKKLKLNCHKKSYATENIIDGDLILSVTKDLIKNYTTGTSGASDAVLGTGLILVTKFQNNGNFNS